MMNEPTKQQTSRRGFGAAFLAAMHDWRQRQAAREIEYYQHLIHKPRAHEGWLGVGRHHLANERLQQDHISQKR